MRVSTSQLFALGVAGMARQEEALLHTQQQLASGKRILTPSDDPVASTQALAVKEAKNRLDQFVANIGVANDALSLDDSVLGQIGDVLQNVRTLALSAGNAGMTNSDRGHIATEVAARLEQLIGLANSKDGSGNFMFAGFAVATQPFVATTGGGVMYNGDQGVRELDVAPGRSLPIAENGAALFEHIRNGNGTFVAAAATTNTGSGVIVPGQVVNAAALTGHTYRLRFNIGPMGTTYDVFDVTASTTVSLGNVYKSGAAITVAGMQTTITGSPATGDQFTLTPSTAQSMFTTLANLAAALRAPASGPVGSARLSNDLNSALVNIDQALEHALTTRAGVGSRLRELDSLAAGNEDRNLNYEQALSGLVDLDYSRALSDFAKQQMALTAAQKSFAQVTGLSLFDYL